MERIANVQLAASTEAASERGEGQRSGKAKQKINAFSPLSLPWKQKNVAVCESRGPRSNRIARKMGF